MAHISYGIALGFGFGLPPVRNASRFGRSNATLDSVRRRRKATRFIGARAEVGGRGEQAAPQPWWAGKEILETLRSRWPITDAASDLISLGTGARARSCLNPSLLSIGGELLGGCPPRVLPCETFFP